jgi:hypothetical protein
LLIRKGNLEHSPDLTIRSEKKKEVMAVFEVGFEEVLKLNSF